MIYSKIAGLKRPQKPKVLQGANATDSDANKHDGIDCVNEAQTLRGINPSYAIPRDAINADLRENGRSFVRLFGDEFPVNAESQINLLSDLTSLVGAGSLINNNAVTFPTETIDDESPLYEQIVANFVSSSTQYLSVASAAALQVGTASFHAAIIFQGLATSVREVLFSYGSHVTGKGYWEIGFNPAGNIFCEIYDGTNTNNITDNIPNRFLNGLYHTAQLFCDRTRNVMYLTVDGIMIGSITVTATATITQAAENFYIGAAKDSTGTIGSFYNGRLALFKLVQAADYSIHAIFLMGTREAVISGTWLAPTANSSIIASNQLVTPNTNLAYDTSVINIEEGEYELWINYTAISSGGKLDVLVDGNTILAGLDTYAASTVNNSISVTKGIKFSSGRHVIKIKNNGKNASSSGNAVTLGSIMLIKKKGLEDIGVKNILLIANDLDQANNPVAISVVAQMPYGIDCTQISSPATLDYIQSILFLQSGLYNIEFNYRKNIDRGFMDIYFGNVKAFSQIDCYNSSSVSAVSTVQCRLSQGKVIVRAQVNGKNGSSSGYGIAFSAMRIMRIAD
jgi:hypothetical protein